MTDDTTPGAAPQSQPPNSSNRPPAASTPTPAAPTTDFRRLILVIGLVAAGLVWFYWDDVRDILMPPKIEASTVPADALRPESEIRVKSGALDITFTKVGAAITRLTWTGPDGHAETLIGQDSVPNRALLLRLPDREDWADKEFTVSGPQAKDGATELVFERTDPASGLQLVKSFRVYSDLPVIDLAIKMENIGPAIQKGGYTLVVSSAVGEPSELGKDDPLVSVRADRIADHHPVRRMSGVQDWPTEKEKKLAGHGHAEAPVTLEWVVTADKYFGLIVRPSEPMLGAGLRFVRTGRAAVGVELVVPPRNLTWVTNTFHVYAGPKDYQTLAKLPGRQQEAINYWYLGRPATVFLRAVHDRVIANYGVAIVIVTVLFRLFMWPVTSWNLRAMVDLKLANAKLAEIDAREPPRENREARAAWVKEARPWENVQRKATIGVFLPMAILLPVLLILYYALNVGYEFYRQPLGLWITDISKRDPIFLLPILMGAAMMGQLRAMSGNPKKEKSWIVMPVAFTVLFAFFSAGLVLFWLTDTLVGWLQLWIIKRARRETAKPPAPPSQPARA